MPLKTLSILNEAKGLFPSFLPMSIGFIPTDETMAFFKLIAIVFSLICSCLGIAWYIYKFKNRKDN